MTVIVAIFPLRMEEGYTHKPELTLRCIVYSIKKQTGLESPPLSPAPGIPGLYAPIHSPRENKQRKWNGTPYQPRDSVNSW